MFTNSEIFINDFKESNDELKKLITTFTSENREPTVQEKLAVMKNLQKSAFLIHDRLVSLSKKLLDSNIDLPIKDREALKLIVGDISIH